MNDGNEVSYITFPVGLLRGFEKMEFEEVRSMANSAINYAFYLVYKKLECVEESADLIGIKFGNPEKDLEKGKQLFEEYGNCPLVSVNKEIMFQFYKDKKSDFEKLTFATYCGLRSILGNRNSAKTNNYLLIARLLGFNKIEDFENSRYESMWFVSFLSTKNKLRYHLTEKVILNEICLNWGLKYYGERTRGFYFSFKVSQQDLVYYAEKNKKSYKLSIMNADRKKAKLEALKRLN